MRHFLGASPLGPRLERVSTVNRAMARVFWRPCPLLVGARSRWARNTSRAPPRGRAPATLRPPSVDHAPPFVQPPPHPSTNLSSREPYAQSAPRAAVGRSGRASGGRAA
eukprot:3723529-Prymnesium_polylepis.1